MNGPIYIQIRDGFKKTYQYRIYLKKNRFYWENGVWKKAAADETECARWERWCLKRGLLMKTITETSERGTHYRKDFFQIYPPMFGERYACAYCGKKLSKREVQVDHIISVDLAKRSAAVRRKIKEYGWSSVNDPRNLCAACPACNRKKSWKGGLWIFLGRYGKEKWFQIARRIIRLTCCFVIGVAAGSVIPWAGALIGFSLAAIVLVY